MARWEPGGWCGRVREDDRDGPPNEIASGQDVIGNDFFSFSSQSKKEKEKKEKKKNQEELE